MKSYKIYLTKSSEVARRIAKTFQVGDDIQRASTGKVQRDTELVPAVYHGKGYFYCAVTLAENGEHDAPAYELTIC